MFTRQHYKAIAEIIDGVCLMGYEPQGGEQDGADIAKSQIGKDLANYFIKDNPRFDRERFLTACGL
jgi:hypothetical protein